MMFVVKETTCIYKASWRESERFDTTLGTGSIHGTINESSLTVGHAKGSLPSQYVFCVY